MTPLLRRRSKPPLTTEPIKDLDKSHKSDLYSNLVHFNSNNDTPSSPVRPTPSQIEEGVNNGTMKRCALSMLEMSEVKEMRDFGEVMDTIDGMDGRGLVGAANDGDLGNEEDDFLFVDTSERSRDDGGIGADFPMDGFLQTSNGMSRSVSMVSFNTSNKQDLCLSSMMVLPDIVEETPQYITPQSPKESGPNYAKENQDEEKPECTVATAVDSKINENEKNQQQTHEQVKPNTEEDRSNPVRSSLKRRGSTNTLNQSTSSVNNNLRSSIKSIDSTEGKLKRSVSFASLEIRSYNVTLGDAPTPNGPPISLDWEYDPQSQIVEIESYESSKIPRERHELLMPAHHRKYLLMREAGFSRSEIQRAIDEAKRIAKRREKTKKTLHLMPMEAVLESTKRKFGRLVTCRKAS